MPPDASEASIVPVGVTPFPRDEGYEAGIDVFPGILVNPPDAGEPEAGKDAGGVPPDSGRDAQLPCGIGFCGVVAYPPDAQSLDAEAGVLFGIVIRPEAGRDQ